MKIKILKNFSGFKKNQIFNVDGDLVIITGDNGIGKSRLFSSLQSGSKIYIEDSNKKKLYINRDNFDKILNQYPPPSKEIVIEARKDGFKSAELNISDSISKKYYSYIKKVKYFNYNLKLNEKWKTSFVFSFESIYDEKFNLEKVNLIRKWEIKSLCEKYPKVIEEKEKTLEKIVDKMNTLLESIENNNSHETYIKIRRLLTDDIHNLSNWECEINEYNQELKNYNLEYTYQWYLDKGLYKNRLTNSKDEIIAKNLSSGQGLISKLIRLKLALLNNNRNIDCIIFDEIDYPINYAKIPIFIEKIITYFIDCGIQVIIITHNIGLIHWVHYLKSEKNNKREINFYEMKFNSTENNITLDFKDNSSPIEDLENLKKINQLMFSEFKVIIVEGKTDELYIKWYLKKISKVELEQKRHKIKIYPLNGASQICHAYETLKDSKDIFWFVDGDEETKDIDDKADNVHKLKSNTSIEHTINKEILEENKLSLLFNSDFNSEGKYSTNKCSVVNKLSKKGNTVIDSTKIKKIVNKNRKEKILLCEKHKWKDADCILSNLCSKDKVAGQIIDKFLKKGEDVFNDDFKDGIEKIVKYFDLKEKQKL